MPKMKSHRGARKRFSITGSGKVKRNKAFKSHILTKKTSKRKRRLRQEAATHRAPEYAALARVLFNLSDEHLNSMSTAAD